MEYKEWSIGWRNKRLSPAKAQRRKGGSKSLCAFFAPLRLCGKYFLLFALLAFPCSAQPRQAMRPADILRVATVTDAQISPNGQWVVYAVSSVEDDKSISTLWLVRLGQESYSFPNPLPSPTPRR